MARSRIVDKVSRTVDLASHRYAAEVRVSSTGTVAPTIAGANGVYGSQQGVELINAGTIQGSSGYLGTYGGAGVDLAAAGTVLNHGAITGGEGGGAGALLAAGCRLENAGAITGGYAYGGPGGVGVGAQTSFIANHGTIIGGSGGYSNSGQIGGIGGTGVILAGGGLFNGNIITGGEGGFGGFFGEAFVGGVGVAASADTTVRNLGTIAGGEGGSTDYSIAQAGGAGVALSTGAMLLNKGDVIGGNGASYAGQNGPGSDGGVGVTLATLSSGVNNGFIAGGDGGGVIALSPGYSAGNGGVGVQLGAATSFTNHETITGGTGGNGTYNRDFGGAGGAGVYLGGGTTFSNDGTISGGIGGPSSYQGASGGAGGNAVLLNGGTLIDFGTLIGGAAGQGPGGRGSHGAAVAFGAASGTLVIGAGAAFKGDISANMAVNDTLVLAGSAAGTLSGFGSTVTGFTTVVEEADKHWTLAGTLAGAGAITLGQGAALTLDGTVSLSSLVFAQGGGQILILVDPAAFSTTIEGFAAGDTIDLHGLRAASLRYGQGTLTLFDANHHAIDALTFSGDYTGADFTLHTEGAGTEILFAGMHLPDFETPGRTLASYDRGVIDHGSGGWGASRNDRDASPSPWHVWQGHQG